MENKTGQDVITIGGKDYPVTLTYDIIMSIYKVYWNHGYKEGDVISIDFFVWVIWKIINKKGIYPFRKPFRSIHVLKKAILFDEMPVLVQYIQTRIFQVRVGETQVKKKRVRKK
jgi:hypothetical protein